MARAEVQIDALGDVQAAGVQPRGQVARRVDRVVGQHQERDLQLGQPPDELGRAGQRLVLVHEHPVHVHQPRLDLAHTARVARVRAATVAPRRPPARDGRPAAGAGARPRSAGTCAGGAASSARSSISSIRSWRSITSSRRVAMLVRVTSSPTRSATSSRCRGSLLTAGNATGVAAYARSASRPWSVSEYTVRSRVLPGSLRASQVAQLGQPLGLHVVLALARPGHEAVVARHPQQVVRAHALPPDQAEDLVGEQAELIS